ncbi:hypothetical protein PINS_up019529 [Pythium insidiosum]|nr:hypothetical protein PINS_up004341 [Pythium insidiosum]GLE08368.1 hypothetical protein PINS_up019529 [Pythium insidiosum]
MELQMTRNERLREELVSWRPSQIFYDLEPRTATTSCVVFGLHVSSYSAAFELHQLRRVHLVARSGYCLTMFRSMLRDGGPFDGGPFDGGPFDDDSSQRELCAQN